ncbi:MAG: DUF559 domain-containing protein [Armatimonadia bacterium]
MDTDNIIRAHHQSRKRVLARSLRQEMTPAEGLLWKHLRRNQLGGWHFRRQQIIDGYIVDFYCHQVGLVVELDGDVHAFQREWDEHREVVLRRRGLQILRFTNSEVSRNLTGVLDHIVHTADKRASESKRTK